MRIKNKKPFDMYFPYAGTDNKGYKVKAGGFSPELPARRFHDKLLQQHWKGGTIDIVLTDADKAVLGPAVAGLVEEQVRIPAAQLPGLQPAAKAAPAETQVRKAIAVTAARQSRLAPPRLPQRRSFQLPSRTFQKAPPAPPAELSGDLLPPAPPDAAPPAEGMSFTDGAPDAAGQDPAIAAAGRIAGQDPAPEAAGQPELPDAGGTGTGKQAAELAGQPPAPDAGAAHCTQCSKTKGVKPDPRVGNILLCMFCRMRVTVAIKEGRPPLQAAPPPEPPELPEQQAQGCPHAPQPEPEPPAPPTDLDAPVPDPHVPGVPSTPPPQIGRSLADLQAQNHRLSYGTPSSSPSQGARKGKAGPPKPVPGLNAPPAPPAPPAPAVPQRRAGMAKISTLMGDMTKGGSPAPGGRLQ